MSDSSQAVRDIAKQEHLRQYFPQLDGPELCSLIAHHSELRRFTAGQELIAPGVPMRFVPLIIDGTLKVSRTDGEGREVFLYFLQAGDTCALSLECSLPGATSRVLAVAEEDGEMLALPTRFLETWTDEFPAFRTFIIATYRRRFEELLSALDGIAFHKLDERLLDYLRELSTARNSLQLKITHQELATHLGSTREVISRLMKQAERLGKVRLGRNLVELLDRAPHK